MTHAIEHTYFFSFSQSLIGNNFATTFFHQTFHLSQNSEEGNVRFIIRSSNHIKSHEIVYTTWWMQLRGGGNSFE